MNYWGDGYTNICWISWSLPEIIYFQQPWATLGCGEISSWNHWDRIHLRLFLQQEPLLVSDRCKPRELCNSFGATPPSCHLISNIFFLCGRVVEHRPSNFQMDHRQSGRPTDSLWMLRLHILFNRLEYFHIKSYTGRLPTTQFQLVWPIRKRICFLACHGSKDDGHP